MNRPIIIGLTAACLSIPTLASAETIERDFHEVFDVGPGAVLELEHRDGDVEIRPWEHDRIEVDVRYRANATGLKLGGRGPQVEFQQAGNVVSVTDHGNYGLYFGSLRVFEHKYTVNAPAYVVLEIRGDDGDISIQDWAADVQLSLQDGDVTIDGLRAGLDVTIDDGDLDLRRCDVTTATLRLEDGDATIRGGSGSWNLVLDDGDVDASELAAGAVRVRSQDGDIVLSLADAGPIDIDLETDDGDVTLRLPATASATFEVRVDDGSMSVQTAHSQIETASEHSMRGVIGSGGGRIRVVTQDGDVRIRDAD